MLPCFIEQCPLCDTVIDYSKDDLSLEYHCHTFVHWWITFQKNSISRCNKCIVLSPCTWDSAPEVTWLSLILGIPLIVEQIAISLALSSMTSKFKFKNLANKMHITFANLHKNQQIFPATLQGTQSTAERL